ncbi:hypothetical protein BJX99DRAFT_272903 [Aspergillus californicus]
MDTSHQLPDGIDPRHKIFIGIAVMMTFLSTVFASLRIASQLVSIKLKWDDWLCVGAVICAYGDLVCIVLVATVAQDGHHVQQYDHATLAKRMQILLANNVIYNTAISLVRASILLFYRRIFMNSTPFTYATLVMGALIVGFWLSTFFSLIFTYSPAEAQWMPWMPHTKISTSAYWLTTGILNILYEVIILSMPQPLIWRMNMTFRRRVLVSFVFALGGFVCLTSIVRVYAITGVDEADPTYTLFMPDLLTTTELNMSIICACLPMLPNLVKHLTRRYYGLKSRNPYHVISLMSGRRERVDAFDLVGVPSVYVRTDVIVEWEGRGYPKSKSREQDLHWDSYYDG